MSLDVSSTESFDNLITKLVGNLPLDNEKRMSISDFGKLLFTEGANSRSASALSKKKEDEAPAAGPSRFDKNFAPNSYQEIVGSTESKALSLGSKRIYNNTRNQVQNGSSEVEAIPQDSTNSSISQKAVRKLLNTKEKAIPQRWTNEEDDQLRNAVARYGERNWKSIAEKVTGRNHTQCLQRWTKVLAPGLIKGHWRPDEDQLLRDLVAEGRKNWGQVASQIPGRTSKQCRERWYNHLDPSIIRGEYTPEEDCLILETQAHLGNRWSAIAAMLPGRTEDAVKIRWKSLCRVKRSESRQRNTENEKKQMAITRLHPDQDGHFYSSMNNTYQHPVPNVNVISNPMVSNMYGFNSGNEYMEVDMVPSYCVSTSTPHNVSQPSCTPSREYNLRADMHPYPMQPKIPSTGPYSAQDNSSRPNDAMTANMYPNHQYTMATYASQEGGHELDKERLDGERNLQISPVYNHHGYTVPMHSQRMPVDFQHREYNAHQPSTKASLAAPSHPSYPSNYGYTQVFDAPAHSPAADQMLRSDYNEMYGNYCLDSKQVSSSESHQKGQMAVNMITSAHADNIIDRASVTSATGDMPAYDSALVVRDYHDSTTPSEYPRTAFTQSANGSPNKYLSSTQPSPPRSEPSQQSKGPKLCGNPVAAFLKKQQMRKQEIDMGEPSPGSSCSQTGLYASVHPSNTAVAYMQRSMEQRNQSSEKQTAESSSAPMSTPPSSTQDTVVIDDKEPAWKKVRPRTSFDATRTSITRRLRTSSSGSGLIGRGSLDVFLSEIGDLGRISDLKMEEFQGMEAVWRVSDDMSRLSL